VQLEELLPSGEDAEPEKDRTKLRLCWELTAFVFGLYCIVCIPFRICFVHDSARSLWSRVIDNCVDFVSNCNSVMAITNSSYLVLCT
jgi:hypothetical protein